MINAHVEVARSTRNVARIPEDHLALHQMKRFQLSFSANTILLTLLRYSLVLLCYLRTMEKM